MNQKKVPADPTWGKPPYWIFKMAAIKYRFSLISQLLGHVFPRFKWQSVCFHGQGIHICHFKYLTMVAILDFKMAAIKYRFSLISQLLGHVFPWFKWQSVCFHGQGIHIYHFQYLTMVAILDFKMAAKKYRFSLISQLLGHVFPWFKWQSVCFHGQRIQIYHYQYPTMAAILDFKMAAIIYRFSLLGYLNY